ncbi:MAG: hypothetical protein K6F48_01650, partial [Paludibacteraceae bacterium]|nr:hypothetical protein [Paludibacteraceae bacterium]
MKKGLLIVAVVVVVAAMAVSYFYFKQQQNGAVSAIDAVPVNSAAIIEVKDARAVMKRMKSSRVFADVAEVGSGAEFAANLLALDSLLNTNPTFA